jgi:hypothetical protein
MATGRERLMGLYDGGIPFTPKGFIKETDVAIQDPNNLNVLIDIYYDDLRYKVWENSGRVGGQAYVNAWKELLSSFDPETRARIYNQSVTDRLKPIFAPGYFNPDIMEAPMASVNLIKTNSPKLETQAPGGMVIAPNPNAPKIPSASQPATLPATEEKSNMNTLYLIAGGIAAFFLAKKARIF